jgi:asparagine synthase (glutamine-hydrolysing)
MGVSLEARVPFLDHRLIELAWRLPLHFKLRGGTTKWILRQLLYRYVPRELVDRPKSGFAVPLSTWLRGPLREFAEDLLAESKLRQDGWFDAQLVRSLWSEHIAGRRNWEQPLWSVLMFQAWLAQEKACDAAVTREVPIHAD